MSDTLLSALMSLSEPFAIFEQDDGVSVVPRGQQSQLETTGAVVGLARSELRRRLPRRSRIDGVRSETSRLNDSVKLLEEVVSRPGFSLHNGRIGRRSVVVKTIKRKRDARTKFEATISLSQGFAHPNILRVSAVYSPSLEPEWLHGLSEFPDSDWLDVPQIAPGSFGYIYVCSNASWLQAAEVPLAAALEEGVLTSIAMGLELVATLASGIEYLNDEGIFPEVENLVILRDIAEKFLIEVDLPTGRKISITWRRTRLPWTLLNSLCFDIFAAANHIFLDQYFRSGSVDNTLYELMRREYVWRNINPSRPGQGSLRAISSQARLELTHLSGSVHDMTSTHRCASHIRPGTITHVQSDVVAPLLEIGWVCELCHNHVGTSHEAFRCICGETLPGPRVTVRCRECRSWSHSDCVGDPDEFTCTHCVASTAQVAAPLQVGYGPGIHHPAPPVVAPANDNDEDMPTTNYQPDLCCGSYLRRGSSSIDPTRHFRELSASILRM
ncbi:hypothetical protein FB45DRAFT_262342 [Roridomyces roridus]|uniref:Uncharacterized protein n=1 Tax=Roridomyces roridus TaxID=1738132 RepID=A0AAD7B8Q9_9AGAR|nr:hypothetical protein FB45DRAFT_262342 [Roridomyces roridus]